MKFPLSTGLVGLTADSSDEALAAKIKALKAQADESVKLKAELKVHKEAAQLRKQKEIVTLVDEALAAKKITAAQKDAYTKLATADYESTKIALDAMTPIVRLADIPNKTGGGGAPATPVTGVTHNGKSYLQLMDSDPNELSRLEREDNDTYMALYNSEFADEIEANERAANART